LLLSQVVASQSANSRTIIPSSNVVASPGSDRDEQAQSILVDVYQFRHEATQRLRYRSPQGCGHVNESCR
jgi:hypothetical protein